MDVVVIEITVLEATFSVLVLQPLRLMRLIFFTTAVLGKIWIEMANLLSCTFPPHDENQPPYRYDAIPSPSLNREK